MNRAGARAQAMYKVALIGIGTSLHTSRLRAVLYTV